jgi:hypothetical protein
MGLVASIKTRWVRKLRWIGELKSQTKHNTMQTCLTRHLNLSRRLSDTHAYERKGHEKGLI